MIKVEIHLGLLTLYSNFSFLVVSSVLEVFQLLAVFTTVGGPELSNMCYILAVKTLCCKCSTELCFLNGKWGGAFSLSF